MRRQTVAAIAAVSVIAFSQIAAAADLPRKAPSAPPPPAAVYNWTGLYLGINCGYGWGPTNGDWFALRGGNFDINGGLFGAQIGFNYQLPGSPLVLGVEADWDWANIKGSNSATPFGIAITHNAKISDLATVRGRVGYAWDRVLLYGTGGWAWTHKASVDFTCPAGGCIPLSGADSQSLSGYTVGGGVEYGITPNLSAKAEYLYAHLNSTNFFTGIGCTGTCNVGANINVVRLGLNWRFSRLP